MINAPFFLFFFLFPFKSGVTIIPFFFPSIATITKPPYLLPSSPFVNHSLRVRRFPPFFFFLPLPQAQDIIALSPFAMVLNFEKVGLPPPPPPSPFPFPPLNFVNRFQDFLIFLPSSFFPVRGRSLVNAPLPPLFSPSPLHRAGSHVQKQDGEIPPRTPPSPLPKIGLLVFSLFPPVPSPPPFSNFGS